MSEHIRVGKKASKIVSTASHQVAKSKEKDQPKKAKKADGYAGVSSEKADRPAPQGESGGLRGKAAAVVDKAVHKLGEAVLQDLGDSRAARAFEKSVFKTLDKAASMGALQAVIRKLAEKDEGPLGGLGEEQREGLIMQATGVIEAELFARKHNYPSWEQLSAGFLAKVRDTAVPPSGPGAPSAFTNPAFLREFEQLTGARFRSGNQVELLAEAGKAWEARKALIQGAPEFLYVTTWAIYDEGVRGKEMAELLVQKNNELKAKFPDDPQRRVRVIVDGQVAARPGHGELVAYLEANGVEVGRWRDNDCPGEGTHRKFITDGKHLLSGGRNAGDEYLLDGQWVDTEQLFAGPVAVDAAAQFRDIWNAQCDFHGLGGQPDPFGLRQTRIDDAFIEKVRRDNPEQPGGAAVAFVNHVAGLEGDAHINLAYLKAIEGATESVDIANAYLIQSPALREAIRAALERGVKVRVLGNGPATIDEAILSTPNTATMRDWLALGAEIYTQSERMLHAKDLIVDGLVSVTGSHNHHPRSYVYEGEQITVTVDRGAAAEHSRVFEQRIAEATRITRPEQIAVKETLLSKLIDRFIRNQL